MEDERRTKEGPILVLLGQHCLHRLELRVVLLLSSGNGGVRIWGNRAELRQSSRKGLSIPEFLSKGAMGMCLV